ncbi:MAG: hypothetical protein R3E82_18065 [Pseudomonadales bacterium]|nr:hypothetical protein [Pseudomonadales bacterium]
MNESTFNDLLDQHGADLSQWPADEIAAAQGLLERSPVAQRSRAAAETLERVARELGAADTPTGLQSRILARAGEPDVWERLADWFQAALWRPLTAGALPLLMGFVIGMQSPASTDTALLAELSALPLTPTIEDIGYDE